MSDVMLLGVLRMPIEYQGGPLSPMAQFVSRAREAADRIEADAAINAQLLEALRGVLDSLEWHADRHGNVGMDAQRRLAARAAIKAAEGA